jgi:glycine dehydrogenase subunit 1
MNPHFYHRYIPNSAPGVREAMLREIGVNSVDELYEEIPESLRFKDTLNLPPASKSEMEVGQHIKNMLAQNRHTDELLSFLGAGCYPHYVPALCSEIIGRAEFLTAYIGSEGTDLGKYQAIFEYQSMIGDLLAMDVVGAPVYDGPSAAGHAVQMAARVTERGELLVPASIAPDRLKLLQVYSESWLEIKLIPFKPKTGQLDLHELEKALSNQTAAVYLENPTYLGVIEGQCAQIAELAHRHGALLIAYVNPISLGVLTPPGEYGADIVCGEGQPLGVPMFYGGATLGIIASTDDARLISAMPSFLVGMTTTVSGERAYSRRTLIERTVFQARDRARSFTGSSSWLWGIATAVYLSLMGPQGMAEVGEINMQKAHYAMRRLSGLKGVRTPLFEAAHFNEFVVNFDGTDKTVAEVNRALLEHGILGGKDLSKELPALGQSALYCATELHTQRDIDRLAETLAKIIS